MSTIQPRKRRRPRPAIPLAITEAGLEERYRRGDVAVDHRAPDPDSPNRSISRAYVVCAYDHMERVGAITHEQREAADRYAVLREQELGASWRNGESAGAGSRAPWDKGNPTQTALLAAAALREIHYVLGTQARTVINLLIMNNMSAKAMAAHLGLDPSVTRGRIDAALTRMVEHMGLDGDRVRNHLKNGR